MISCDPACIDKLSYMCASRTHDPGTRECCKNSDPHSVVLQGDGGEDILVFRGASDAHARIDVRIHTVLLDMHRHSAITMQRAAGVGVGRPYWPLCYSQQTSHQYKVWRRCPRPNRNVLIDEAILLRTRSVANPIMPPTECHFQTILSTLNTPVHHLLPIYYGVCMPTHTGFFLSKAPSAPPTIRQQRP
jgi:hypothetical protein